MPLLKKPKPQIRHYERRTARQDVIPEVLDRRKHPSNTPMGAAQMIETISKNYPDLLRQARRDRASKSFLDLLEERHARIRTKYLDKLVTFSERDEGTGLLNKRGFLLRTRQYITNPTRVFTYVYLDLNNLKKINDNFGHGLGNEYLHTIGVAATTVAAQYEHTDIRFTIARTGGDEFELLISAPRTKGYDYEAIAREIITKLHDISRKIWAGQRIKVSQKLRIDTKNIPELSFASGYDIGLKRCPITIKDITEYSHLSQGKLKIIDEHLEDLKTVAESRMYEQKAKMKTNNGR